LALDKELAQGGDFALDVDVGLDVDSGARGPYLVQLDDHGDGLRHAERPVGSARTEPNAMRWLDVFHRDVEVEAELVGADAVLDASSVAAAALDLGDAHAARQAGGGPLHLPHETPGIARRHRYFDLFGEMHARHHTRPFAGPLGYLLAVPLARL